MTNKHTVAVLVRNQFGVLNRVTSMFRRRQFNISALTVSETESADYSRITVVFDGEEMKKQQLINQLYKLPDVCAIRELQSTESINCELVLLKTENSRGNHQNILREAEKFGATIVCDNPETIVFQLADESEKIDEFINVMREFNILEICRTGSVSLEKGKLTLREMTNM